MNISAYDPNYQLYTDSTAVVFLNRCLALSLPGQESAHGPITRINDTSVKHSLTQEETDCQKMAQPRNIVTMTSGELEINGKHLSTTPM